MRKEIIVAIFVGIIFGGIFAFGIRRANVALNPDENLEKNTSNQTQNTNTSTEKEVVHGLSILSPQQNDVFTENPVTISGMSKPNSTVVISAEDEDFVLITDNTGEFKQDVDLSGGLNNILINSYDGRDTIGEEVLHIVYTTELDI